MTRYTNADIYRLIERRGQPMTANQIADALDLPPKDALEMIYLYARLRGMAKRRKNPIYIGLREDGRLLYGIAPTSSRAASLIAA